MKKREKKMSNCFLQNGRHGTPHAGQGLKKQWGVQLSLHVRPAQNLGRIQIKLLPELSRQEISAADADAQRRRIQCIPDFRRRGYNYKRR